MSPQPAYTRLSFDPLADPRAVVEVGPARFTVITSRAIRMEYSPEGRFEDRPSQVFWYRRKPVPPFTVEADGQGIILTTDSLRLEYRGGPFAPETLRVTSLSGSFVWHYGDPDKGNLLGTARTLDKVSGSTRLEPGLLSQDGWSVIDDSRTLVFDETGWLVPRGADSSTLDLYFFGYGRAFSEALRDYRALTGNVPLLPRWVLGNWWSRYWAYTDEELLALMRDFQEHEVPLAVCVVDMDWHLVDIGEGINGWTGYTWNPALFPRPEEFIARMHEMGLRTSLNLHPALGVRPHEAMYDIMAERMGLDPAAGTPVPFDIASRRFADAYFEVLHHPQEAIGIDFWWIDWQQGTQTTVAGLDPLWWLNHLHFYDLGRDGKRPFIFSRWGGLGNHRYPIGFSGDTIVSWESLRFQPYFTATAANVGYGWWSHDIGGHMQGIEDRELYTRWVQFGVFSPIFRLHSTNNPFHERRPWGYDSEVLRITRDAMQLRHALIPYLYTMSRFDESGGPSPVRPMYHDYPDCLAAYACPQQYLFGTDLVVAPHTSPADPDTRLSRGVVWLPPGDWYDFFTGEYYQGDAWYARYGALDDVPVFARAGSIIPLGPRVGWGGLENPAELHLHVFTGADGRFALYEDDGETIAYRDGAWALTRFEQRWEENQVRVLIAPPSGDISNLPPDRRYFLHAYGLGSPGAIRLLVGGNTRPVDFTYDPVHEIIHIGPIDSSAAEALQITISPPRNSGLLSRRDRTPDNILRLLTVFRMNTLAKAWLAARSAELPGSPDLIAEFGLELAPSHIRALLETTQHAGSHAIQDMGEENLLVVWNNHQVPALRYHYSQLRPEKWHAHERYQSSLGTAPKFLVFRPEGRRWRLVVDYFGLHTEVYTGRTAIDF